MNKDHVFTLKGFHNTAQGRRFGAPWVSEYRVPSLEQSVNTRHDFLRLKAEKIVAGVDRLFRVIHG